MKKAKHRLCLLMTLLIIATNTSVVHAQEEEPADRTPAPYFFIEGIDPSVDRLPLKATEVTANINGTIAELYVTQTYCNEGKNPINATYVFPASTDVTIHGMKMQIGDQLITAKIKEKEEAKQEFEIASNEGKNASLLEQHRPNAFTMNVSNLMPGQTIRLELHYTELIQPTEGTYQFVFPTVAGPRYAGLSNEASNTASNEASSSETIDSWASIPYVEDPDTDLGTYDITVNLSTGAPITGLTCKSHEVSTTWTDTSNARITLSNPEDFAGNRDFILDYRLMGEEIDCGLALYEGETENFFMLTVQPPNRCEPEEIPPREYIFVLDVSGSMNGYPLDTAKDVISNLVSGLRETDSFNLILFSGASVQMAPRSVTATAENIDKAIRLIDQQDGSGGTELAPALTDAAAIPAMDDTARSIVIITDGYIYGETEIFDIITSHSDTANFFAFGIGSAVNRYLIEGIAKTGQGEAFIVTEEKDAAETAERFHSYIASPVLTDIQVNYGGFDVYDVEPVQLPTLFAKKPIVLFGKWKGTPSGTIRLTGQNGDSKYSKELFVSNVQPSESNRAIQYLWARSRMERLTYYGLNENDPAVKEEVTALGLTYSMITPYTSFIAVAETIQNPAKDSKEVNQPSPLPSQVSPYAVGYTIGSEPGTLLSAGAAFLLLAVLPLFRKVKSRLQRCGGCYLTALALIIGIKLFYTSADCEALNWILAPTAQWVQILTGISFEKDIRLGYVNHTLRFIIAPSCSGIRFMLVLFAAFVFPFTHRMQTLSRKTAWLTVSGIGSYLFTVLINGIRIVLSIYLPALLTALFSKNLFQGWLTPELLHTAIGTVTYFGFLLFLYPKADRFSQSFAVYSLFRPTVPSDDGHLAAAPVSVPCRHRLRDYLPATACYFFIVLGIPLVHRLLQGNPTDFIGYAVLVIAFCFLTFSALGLFLFLKQRIQKY